MGYCPKTLLLIGCQPEELEDYGGGLRAIVADQIEPAIHIALTRLAQMGVVAKPGRTASNLLADPSIMHAAYEAGRPTEEEACRTGDDRFFPAAE